MSISPRLLTLPPSRAEIALLDKDMDELTPEDCPGYSRVPLGDSWNTRVSWVATGRWLRSPMVYRAHDRVTDEVLAANTFNRPTTHNGYDIHEGNTLTVTIDMRVDGIPLDDVQMVNRASPIIPLTREIISSEPTRQNFVAGRVIEIDDGGEP